MSEARQHFQAKITAQLAVLKKTWAMMVVVEEQEKKAAEEKAQHEAEEQERLRKEAEKRAEEECHEKECREAEEAAKKRAAPVAKEQLVGVVVPGVDKMCKEKQRAEAEVEEVSKWQGPCNWCVKKNLQCIPYEG
jgi:translation initiation factor IF-2